MDVALAAYLSMRTITGEQLPVQPLMVVCLRNLTMLAITALWLMVLGLLLAQRFKMSLVTSAKLEAL